MRKGLAFFCAALMVSFAYAQHCGYDGTSLIIVEVVDASTGKKINDLNIKLTNSKWVPYTHKWNRRNYANFDFSQNTDTLKFGQNFVEQNSSRYKYDRSLPFADSSYILFVYPNNYSNVKNESNNDLIVVEPFYPKKEAFYYEGKSVRLKRSDIQYLCTEGPVWKGKEYVDKVTIKVNLERKMKK